VHQPGHESLEQLLLAENDLDLVARALEVGTGPVRRLRVSDESGQEPGAPGENPAADEDERGETDRAGYPCAFRSSALIAGTTSCRSPITA